MTQPMLENRQLFHTLSVRDWRGFGAGGRMSVMMVVVAVMVDAKG